MLALAGCGLEEIIVLEPPVPDIASGTSTFSFKATSANSEPAFLGFEVYYRIYATTDDPYPTYFNSFEEMTTGTGAFQRLYDPQWAPGAPGFSKPFIAPDPADFGTDYKVTIDFNVIIADTSYPQVSSSGLSTEVVIPSARRSIAGLLEYKRFQESAFISGEPDITTNAYASITTQPYALPVKIVMFAVSYGYDTSKFMEVYSPPVLIGNEDLFIRDFSL